jgi:archaeosine synthase beta-subunit
VKRAERDREVRALRPPKLPVDPWRPLGVLRERERTPGPQSESVVEEGLTVFLAGRECPFTCVFCDLWRHTLDSPTPPGAIPRQIELALEGNQPLPTGWIKLYNASNFFDPLAVPREDWPAIGKWLAPFERVVVECHPKMVGEGCERFAELLCGRLEVAMGLETVEPRALARLNKGMTVADFDAAAARLRDADIGVRAFVLIGAPFVPRAEAIEWTVRSVEHALEVGAEVVSLIPMRGGNGELDRLAEEGEFTAPRLVDVEEVFERSLEACADSEGLVQVDMWDLEGLAGCPRCAAARIERLRRMNLSGEREPRVVCEVCEEGVG